MPISLVEKREPSLPHGGLAVRTSAPDRHQSDLRDIVSRMYQQADNQVKTHATVTQRKWAARSIAQRIAVLKRARHLFASRTDDLCAAMPGALSRTPADTLVAEILPLLAAIRFLEQEASSILAPRPLGSYRRPLWLSGVVSEIQRVPFGTVLIIAPSNYPLFLAGTQVLQALAAGNAVIWKPGAGGRRVALLFEEVMLQAGLPQGLIEITAESVEAAQAVIAKGVDKVFFTGSITSGKALLHQLADTLTPCVVELSGCEAVFILPSADLARVAKALAFGMRLNGSATCMAPRRIILVGADAARGKSLIDQLMAAFDWIKGISLPQHTRTQVDALVYDAINDGAQLHVKLAPDQQPVLLTGVTPAMKIANADVFAPVLSLMEASDVASAIAMNDACPFALTASIFGKESAALELASSITAGTITINDLIVPTADPRVPFGGRRKSGFGVTRGAEGLLEMTAPRTIAVRRGRDTRHFDATTTAHAPFFQGIIRASHGATWIERFAGIRQILSAAKNLNRKQ